MRCFARWKEDISTGLCFRDQTILQFGDNWDLLASFVLLNPGSAMPRDMKPCDEFLREKDMLFFVEGNGSHYYEFSIDRLMRDLLNLYAANHSGGVLKLYNLFNLKNQDSASAMEQFKANKQHPDMFTPDKDIRYGDAPVIIGAGDNAFADAALTGEMKKCIAKAKPDQLYALSKVGDHLLSFIPTKPDDDGLVSSYHPSYAFKYGNQTQFGDKT